MKKLQSALCAFALAMTSALPVHAVDFVGSVTQTGVAPAAESISVGGTNVSLMGAGDDFATTTNPAIMVASAIHHASQVTAMEDGQALSAHFGEKTADGVLFEDALKAALLQKDVTAADSLSSFLEKFPSADKIKAAANGSVDDYAPVALMDISANDAAKALGTADIPVNVAGVKAGQDTLAVHFIGDLKETEATKLADVDSEDMLADMDVEVLPSKAEKDGVVTVSMDSYSPVMILVKDADTAAAASTNTSVGTNTYVLIGVMAVAAFALVILIAKKKTLA